MVDLAQMHYRALRAHERLSYKSLQSSLSSWYRAFRAGQPSRARSLEAARSRSASEGWAESRRFVIRSAGKKNAVVSALTNLLTERSGITRNHRESATRDFMEVAELQEASGTNSNGSQNSYQKVGGSNPPGNELRPIPSWGVQARCRKDPVLKAARSTAQIKIHHRSPVRHLAFSALQPRAGCMEETQNERE